MGFSLSLINHLLTKYYITDKPRKLKIERNINSIACYKSLTTRIIEQNPDFPWNYKNISKYNVFFPKNIAIKYNNSEWFTVYLAKNPLFKVLYDNNLSL